MMMAVTGGNVKGVGEQEGDGRRGTEARKHADQRSHEHADKTEEKVHRLKRTWAPKSNMGQNIHDT